MVYRVNVLEEGDDDENNEKTRLCSPLERLKEHAKQFYQTEQEWALQEEHYKGIYRMPMTSPPMRMQQNAASHNQNHVVLSKMLSL